MNMNSPRHDCSAVADSAFGEVIAAGSLTSLGDPAAPLLNKPCALIGEAPPARWAPVVAFTFMGQRRALLSNCLGRRAHPCGRANHGDSRRSVSFIFRPAAPISGVRPC